MINLFYYIRFYILLWFTKTFNKEIVNKIEKNDYDLIFHDEFNDPILDTEKWATHEHWGFIKDGVAWVPEQIELEKGNCILTTDRYSGTNPVTDLDGTLKHIDNVSGMICSYKSLNRKYGYYEIRAKIPPDGIKYWPAFWFESKESWPPEIDVFEFMAPGDSRRMTMTYHWLDDEKNKDKIVKLIIQCYTKKLIPYIPKTINDTIKLLQQPPWSKEKQDYIDTIIKLRVHRQYGKGLSGYDFSKKYHVYALGWEPDKITWYFDNVAVFRLKDNQWVNFGKVIELPKDPMYVIINNGTHPGNAFKDNEVPMEMPIDYCRIYEK